jgi:hypothetical protein
VPRVPSTPGAENKGSINIPLCPYPTKPFRINVDFARFLCALSTFRMNTFESVSKQRTLSPFRMNTFEKKGWGWPVIVN